MIGKTLDLLIECCKAYYAVDENSVGGSLHIALDDGNLENGDISHCIEYAEANNDTAGVILGKLLLSVSYKQRCELYKHYDKYRH